MELKLRSHFICFFVSGMLIAGTAYAAEVYRWVDENGEVHYSESLPPNYQDKGHDVLNERGIVVDEDLTLTPPPPPPPPPPSKDEPQELPRDSSGLPRPKQLYSEAEMQRRMDNFLMLRYESEGEIVEAMNVEIKQLAYDQRLLETTRDSMLDAYRGQIKEAANRQRSGQPVNDSVSRDINQLRARLAENKTELDRLIERERSIRADFETQLSRYRVLLEEWAEESAGS